MFLRMAGLAAAIACVASSASAGLILVTRGPDPDAASAVHRPSGPYMDGSWLERKLNASGSGQTETARPKGTRGQGPSGQSRPSVGVGAVNQLPGTRPGGNTSGGLTHYETNPIRVTPPTIRTDDGVTAIPVPGAGALLISGLGVIGHLATKRARASTA